MSPIVHPNEADTEPQRKQYRSREDGRTVWAQHEYGPDGGRMRVEDHDTYHPVPRTFALPVGEFRELYKSIEPTLTTGPALAEDELFDETRTGQKQSRGQEAQPNPDTHNDFKTARHVFGEAKPRASSDEARQRAFLVADHKATPLIDANPFAPAPEKSHRVTAAEVLHLEGGAERVEREAAAVEDNSSANVPRVHRERVSGKRAADRVAARHSALREDEGDPTSRIVGPEEAADLSPRSKEPPERATRPADKAAAMEVKPSVMDEPKPPKASKPPAGGRGAPGTATGRTKTTTTTASGKKK